MPAVVLQSTKSPSLQMERSSGCVTSHWPSFAIGHGSSRVGSAVIPVEGTTDGGKLGTSVAAEGVCVSADVGAAVG